MYAILILLLLVLASPTVHVPIVNEDIVVDRLSKYLSSLTKKMVDEYEMIVTNVTLSPRQQNRQLHHWARSHGFEKEWIAINRNMYCRAAQKTIMLSFNAVDQLLKGKSDDEIVQIQKVIAHLSPKEFDVIMKDHNAEIPDVLRNLVDAHRP